MKIAININNELIASYQDTDLLIDTHILTVQNKNAYLYPVGIFSSFSFNMFMHFIAVSAMSRIRLINKVTFSADSDLTKFSYIQI